MPVTVREILDGLNEIAPFAMAESWDNVGLIVGDQSREVQTVLLGLDPTNTLLNEAVQRGADTVITHHPAIFKPLPSINTAEPSGIFLEKALTCRLNVIACHTNFDNAMQGVNDILAELLGLADIKPLIPANGMLDAEAGTGRLGLYPTGMKKEEFIDRLLEILELPSVQIAGMLPDIILTVALCGGSGSDFAETARNNGADLYLSAEIKHNVARWAEECGFCIIDGTHYATEKPAVKLLAERLRAHSRQNGWELSVLESVKETHPFNITDKNSYKH